MDETDALTELCLLETEALTELCFEETEAFFEEALAAPGGVTEELITELLNEAAIEELKVEDAVMVAFCMEVG